MIIQIRVDERLAHGQVCMTWITALAATHLIIANDEVANDEFQKRVMKMGIPGTVKSLFSTVDKTVQLLNDEKSAPLRIFVVCKTPVDASRVIDGIKDPSEVDVNISNYGRLSPPKDGVSLRFNDYISLGNQDIEAVKNIRKKCKDLFFQDVVSRPKTEIDI